MSKAANSLGDFIFEWAARARLQSHGNEARQNFEGGRERGGRGLGAKHGRKGVGGASAGAGGNHVVDGLGQFFTIALEMLEIVAKSAGDSLFDRVGFR